MDAQQPSAPPCAPPPNPRGITHMRSRPTSHYTVVGNHLAQHGQLSLVAIGLAVHIQSVKSGTVVTIKTLADRFPEGETRIAAALRELEHHGYLSRTRERLPNGRVVTQTVSYDVPRHAADALPEPPTATRPRRSPTVPESGASVPKPPSAPPPRAPKPPREPDPNQPPAPPKPPRAPLPEPEVHDLKAHRRATTLLASLHGDDPRLLLAERDVRRLAPAVAAWFERGAAPESVRNILTANLPTEPLHHPAAFLTHRLTALLPAPTPQGPPPSVPSSSAAARPHRAFQTSCEGCDRAFRTPQPGGRCRECRTDLQGAA